MNVSSVMVAPKGTDVWAKGGWEPLGTVESVTVEQETETLHSFNGSRVIPTSRSIRIDLEDGRTIYAPSATFKRISDTEIQVALDHHSIPQRYALGLDQESSLTFVSNPRRSFRNSTGRNILLGTNGYHPEIHSQGAVSGTVLKSEDVPQFAYELFANSGYMPKALMNLPASKEPYISAGKGDSQARVYLPKNDEQAQRNLNFAVANLKAYQQWEQVTKPAIERQQEANLKRLEAEKAAKVKAAIDEAKRKVEELEAKRAARAKAGVDLYNKINGTRYYTWVDTGVPLSRRETWNDKAEEIAKLKSDSFRITPSVITADMINSQSLINRTATNRIFGF